MQRRRHASGFSLMEVNLAILVVALGMLTLFALFPAGLKQVETAQASTQEAMFTGHVLSTLRGKAMEIGAPAWVNINTFRSQVLQNTGLQQGGSITTVQFPAGSGLYVRYLLDISDVGNHLRSVSLWCQSGQYGATDIEVFKTVAAKYYTELFYSGMP